MAGHLTGHFDRVGVEVICAVCRRRKHPRGRDAPPSLYGCSWDECWGYPMKPHVGSLWPGESASAFGFIVGSYGTKVVWVAYPEGWDDD